jgi:hypothetical protein
MIIVPTNTIVNGTVPSPLHLCFDATNTVTVAGGGSTFVVEPGGSAVMIAGVKISYLYGTTVQPGGYMHGYITTTGSYCGSLPPAMVAAVVTGVTGPEEVQPLAVPQDGRFFIYPNPTTGRFTLVRKGGMPELKLMPPPSGSELKSLNSVGAIRRRRKSMARRPTEATETRFPCGITFRRRSNGKPGERGFGLGTQETWFDKRASRKQLLPR